MAAIKALEQWCRIQCDGYRDVAINNMTTSFRDGLAFCALIHKFRPDLINFDSLSKDNVYDNNNLAFRVAEDHLGIPALLDAEDMVALRVPDRLSILTYVSQYYNYFNGRSPIGGVGGLKRPAEGSKEEPSEKKNLPVVARTYTPKTPTENHPPPSTFTQRKTVLVESSNKSGTLNSKCTVCKSHVHLVQRLLVDGKLYHRSCFKCSVCSGPLHPGGHKPGPEPGTLVCTSHQRVPPGPKLPVQPGQRISCTPAEEGPKGENNARSTPRHVSVLSAPVRVGPKPVEPAPPSQPWTPSAQKTQAARQRFFQSPVSTPERPAGRGPQAAPAESSGTQSSTARKAEDKEKERARALISRKLSEGNCNNNNTAYLSGLRVDRRLPSAEVAWRQGNGDEKPAGGKPTRLSPTPPAASPSRSIPNNKESLWLAAISRERARPPSAVLSRARAKDMDVCEASAKCRSKLTPAPNEAENQTPAAEMATVALENSSNICKTHHLSPPHTPSSQTASSSDSSRISSPVTAKPPIPSQLQQASAVGSKNGSISSSCSPASDGTPVVSITSSPSQPSNYKPPSPKQLHHGFADWSSNSRNDSSPTNTSVSEIMPPTIKPHHVPVDQIAEELNEIERDLSELEKEGVELERRLRSCEEEGRGDILMDPLMVEWFNLIRRKQTYIRRESELMYIAKTQDLEEQQPGVEGELRRLMSKPENLKSATERRREAELMTRLVEIVNDRNAIVEGLEIDRLREEEEDQQLDEMMQRLGLKQSKKKRKSSISKLFRRRSKKTSAEE
ncbi:MICAL-like protein 2a [Chanos chanos]|uniref:MICAL-like protein 2a n=1 Tax=Chanos chanos TaxID=29144 RepID=A0A6J2WJ88_CHACN|nr:MICAL-like protein 2 [Chanos chanos]